jgi:hypothetical protein
MFTGPVDKAEPDGWMNPRGTGAGEASGGWPRRVAAQAGESVKVARVPLGHHHA